MLQSRKRFSTFYFSLSTLRAQTRAAFTPIELPCHAVALAKAGRRTNNRQPITDNPIRSGETQAFTLIELLVVIAIIAILMGLLFPAFRSVQDQAKRAQAKNDLTQIATAVNASYTEYGIYPVKQGSTGDCEYNTDNDQLFNVLRGYASSGYQGGLNPKQIQFLQIPVAKDQNAPRSGLGGGVYYDPWGSPYHIKMDGDYDGKVGNPYSAGAGYDPIESGCIAWSLGKDQKGGSNDKTSGDAADDVISWQ